MRCRVKAITGVVHETYVFERMPMKTVDKWLRESLCQMFCDENILDGKRTSDQTTCLLCIASDGYF